MIKIAHLADVHWRGLSRHDEYVSVFKELARQVKDQKIEHIFIGGDLWHTKTMGITPEAVDLMCWWLRELASVAEVHLTLGNHDGNLVNTSRQDAISPIVDALENEHIHLYKKSGVYEFSPGYNWCVFSLFDIEGWPNVKPEQGKINIACYHGPVWGAKTETGWDITDGITVDFFKDYDFAMLGDIHKTQFLQFRDVELIVSESDLTNYPNAEVLEVIG